MRTKPLLGLVTAILFIGVMSIGGPSFAGSGAPAKEKGDIAPLSLTVWKTFSTTAQGGTTVTVSTDGNVLSLTSPTGYQHIYAEGYVLDYPGICAYNYGGASSGFLPSTQGTYNNVVTKTSDSKLQLTQVFTWSAANRQLQIAMTVKNLSAAPVAVTVFRTADLDIDNTPASDWHASTSDSYFAFESFQGHGVMLREISKPSTAVAYYGRMTDPTGPPAWSGCRPVTTYTGPIDGDYAGLVGFGLGNIAAGGRKTVKVAYLRY